MPQITGTQILTDVFQALNVYMPGETLGTNDTATGLRQLNSMLGQWAQQNLTIPAESRTVFLLSTINANAGNTGSSTLPFTIGPGGDLNVTKPPNQSSVTGAGLLLNASTPPVEIQRGVMSNDGYDALGIKDLTSVLFTDVFYLPTYLGLSSQISPVSGTPLGQIFLWPVPTDLTNSLVLYLRLPLSYFADLNTQYNIPDGYDEALFLNLAVRLGRFFGRPATADDRHDARESLATIKRANTQLGDLSNDFASLGSNRGRRGGYNLQTGE